MDHVCPRRALDLRGQTRTVDVSGRIIYSSLRKPRSASMRASRINACPPVASDKCVLPLFGWSEESAYFRVRLRHRVWRVRKRTNGLVWFLCLCFWLLLAYQSRSTVRALIGGISTRAVRPGSTSPHSVSSPLNENKPSSKYSKKNLSCQCCFFLADGSLIFQRTRMLVFSLPTGE